MSPPLFSLHAFFASVKVSEYLPFSPITWETYNKEHITVKHIKMTLFYEIIQN
jgi:hypothetical protein